MSYFASALQQLLESRYEGRGAQTQLATQLGLDRASLSRYLSAESRPDIAVLEQMCQALEPDEVAPLVSSYLRDDIPASAEELVRVVTFGTKAKAPPQPVEPPRSRLPKKLQSAFDYLMEEAARSPAVADSILATVRLLQGRREP